MNRTRRVTVTVVAATGILGAAGAAVATVGGLPGSKVSQNDTAAASEAGARAVSSSDQTDGRSALESYVDTMSRRGARLEDRVSTAEARLSAARAARARLIKIVKARAAAAQAAAEQAATARQEHSSAPSTHTSTGASSGGGGDDDDEDEGEHHDGGGDDD